MGTQNWYNKDGLFLQYGTDKAVPTTAGDYRHYGDFRDVEFTIDLTKLTATAAIVPWAETTFMDGGVFIEQVEVVADVAAVGGTSVSVGMIGLDRSTKPANGDTAFVKALVTASMTPAGKKNVLTTGVTSAGDYLGTATPVSGYFTALAAGTFTEGTIKVRVKYRGVPPITH